MIIREMPDLLPRPETPQNAAFRRAFYQRWGRENSIVCGTARDVEYVRFRQTLSIKYVENGTEDYFIDGRRTRVSDSTYLVLNEGREYGSAIHSETDTFSFAIFFRPGLLDQVAGARRQDVAGALATGAAEPRDSTELAEALRPHDRIVSPVVRFIRHHVAAGVDDPEWYEEQFRFLASRLLDLHENRRNPPQRLECIRASTRAELLRRLSWALEYLHAHLHEEVRLEDLARAACLSRYHFLRLFRQAYGMTPVAYVREQRARRALQLIESTRLGLVEIATRTGFNNRASLARAITKLTGASPRRAASSPAPADGNAVELQN